MKLGNHSIRFTPEGGIGTYFINKTGAPSVKGSMVNTEASVDFGVNLVGADEPDIVGVIYDDGIPDGEEVLVIFQGIADVLLQDSTASTRGYWCRASATQAGRVDMTNAEPPGGTINAIDAHFHECGHCMQSVTAGTDKLARMMMHYN
jgi:hypothetical protein